MSESDNPYGQKALKAVYSDWNIWDTYRETWRRQRLDVVNDQYWRIMAGGVFYNEYLRVRARQKKHHRWLMFQIAMDALPRSKLLKDLLGEK